MSCSLFGHRAACHFFAIFSFRHAFLLVLEGSREGTINVPENLMNFRWLCPRAISFLSC
jgi:hypothetical protein